MLRRYFTSTYAAPNLIVAAVGNIEHEQVRALIERPSRGCRSTGDAAGASSRPAWCRAWSCATRSSSRATSASGRGGYPQDHADRFASYALNTVLGGSMSSRLFQNVREKRGLAYAVFSGLSAYRDAGAMTIYAGCANEAVGELIDVVVGEIRRMKDEPMSDAELRRAKDHLKGSLMLGLESTSSRMSNLARQEMYFDRQFSLDETLQGVEARDPRRRAARDRRTLRASRPRGHGAGRGQRTGDSARTAASRLT